MDSFETGTKVDDVSIDIDYAIIRHFSEHLYSSPNKAIEELASNGFDALATRCYVYIPGSHVTSRVLVWDDGTSMEEDGLKAMWQIARSPKESLGEKRVATDGERERAVIGKFGIGKLASYALGNRISHLCKTPSGRYLSVSVNYAEIAQEHPEAEGVSNPSHVDILELTPEEMNVVLDDLLPIGDARAFMSARPHWTLAVVDDLKDVTLYPGRLSWVLGLGMPLRPDFRIFVEDTEVSSRLAKDASTTWDLSEPKIKDALETAWKEASARSQVEGEYAIISSGTGESPAITFPNLGNVTATVRLFENSLATRAPDEGRSFGFFVTVRGRLVNADDDKLFLHDPSFGTFYRSQFIIEADGLDDELLADRESLRRDTAMTRELQVLQTALYRPARTEVESQDDKKSKGEKPESRLPVRSRELFRDPLAALVLASTNADVEVDLDEPVIDRVDLGTELPLAAFNDADGHLNVNRAHPFYRAIEDQVGSGRKAAAILRAFDLVAVSEQLTEGFLRARGTAEPQIRDLMGWRDRLLRSLGENYARNADDLDLEVRAASVPGDARFELALTALFKSMGFKAVRDGRPGKKDILVTAPLGPEHTLFTIEAKGSKDSVDNVPAALAGAAAHRDEAGASHSIVVAREFSGFKNLDRPAILKECESVAGVSVATVETLIQLRHALLKYSYPLKSVMDALFVIETPSDKAARVEALDKPLDDFNFGQVLDAIWERQQGESAADVVPVRTIWQSNPSWRLRPVGDFLQKVAALDHFAGGLMVYNPANETAYLKHSPDLVAEHVTRSLFPPVPEPAPVEPADGSSS